MHVAFLVLCDKVEDPSYTLDYTMSPNEMQLVDTRHDFDTLGFACWLEFDSEISIIKDYPNQ